MESDNTSISVIILAKNEAEMIGDCLLSVAKLDPVEVLVVDDGSTDETVSIAQFHNATVLFHTRENFAESRNYAADQSKGAWLLYVDADERLSLGLVEELKKTVQETSIDAAQLIRKNYYLGKAWPKTENMLRLFRKKSFRKWQGELHESAIVEGKIVSLDQPLIHFTHRNLSEMVDNTIKWSETEAHLRMQSSHPSMKWWRFPRVMLPTFIHYFFSQKGYSVGAIGLIESMYQAFSMFVTYARLWEFQNR